MNDSSESSSSSLMADGLGNCGRMSADTGFMSIPILDRWTSEGQHRIRIRPIANWDEARVAKYLMSLSFGTRYFRFGRGDIQFDREHIHRICNPDSTVCCRLIAVTDIDGEEIQIGSAAFVVRPNRRDCDISILVADKWRKKRIAYRLLRALTNQARQLGLSAMHAEVLGTNQQMTAFATRFGFVAEAGETTTIKHYMFPLSEQKSMADVANGESPSS